MASIADEVNELAGLGTRDLRVKYAQLFNEHAPSHNRDWLIKRLAWRIQARALGDLTQRARAKALELADDADLRVRMPLNQEPLPIQSKAIGRDKRLPPAGAILVRVYKKKRHEVTVLDDGFEYDGAIFHSLSAVARTITQTNWNGFRFFGLNS